MTRREARLLLSVRGVGVAAAVCAEVALLRLFKAARTVFKWR